MTDRPKESISKAIIRGLLDIATVMGIVLPPVLILIAIFGTL